MNDFSHAFYPGTLSYLIFLPLIAALLLALPVFKGEDKNNLTRNSVLIFCLGLFIYSLKLYFAFDIKNTGFQFKEEVLWLPDFGVYYKLGLDGISLFLVLLTTFLMPIIVLSSQSVKTKLRGYLASMLVLQSAMIGTLVALDAFVFYVFWELMLAPMYFIIGIWGGKRRIYASLKFVIYTVFGSVLMLLALMYLVWQHKHQFGEISFLLSDLLNTSLTLKEELWLFSAFLLAFGIKVPIFPFHTWLPDAHVEAPTGGSVVLAGVLLKMGIYGLIRFAYPLFPNAALSFAPIIAGLAVIGIIYGALVAWVQSDMKKLVAYSSVSHLGYCVLGLAAFNSLSVTGSIYQMLSHGITTGGLFLLVGVLYDRKHSRAISDYSGLATKVPMFAFLFLIFTLGSIALPLTSGFVGEFMILLGSFKEFAELTLLALTGVVFGAVYMLTLYLNTVFGKFNSDKNHDLTDINKTEILTFAPLVILVFAMGIYPKPILSKMEPTVNSYLLKMEGWKIKRMSKVSVVSDDQKKKHVKVLKGKSYAS